MIEEIADASADYGRWTKRGTIREVAISLLRRVSKLQDSYSFGRPPLSGKTMPSFRIFRNGVVFETTSSRPSKRRLQEEITAIFMDIGNLP